VKGSARVLTELPAAEAEELGNKRYTMGDAMIGKFGHEPYGGSTVEQYLPQLLVLGCKYHTYR
jgi:hypothetical protein